MKQKGYSPIKSGFAPIIILVLIALAVAGYFGYKNYWPKQQSLITSTPTATQTPTDYPANWKTYTNTKYEYSIKYPPDWTYREYPDIQTGAGFRPLDKPNEPAYEDININFSGRAMSSQNVPFEDYVKRSTAENIQNFESLETINKVITQTGEVGYTTTWNVISQWDPTTNGGSRPYVSLPITYFDTKNQQGDFIEIDLGDEAYLEIYNKMLSTFRFTDHESTNMGDAATKEECLQKGGLWQKWGLLGLEYCQVPASDANKSCTDNSQCSLGKCIAVEGTSPGKCQVYKAIFGCNKFISNGIVSSKALCTD